MKPLLFSTSAYEYLAQELAAVGTVEVGAIERKYFPDGERYMRIPTDPWARDVVLVGGTPHDLDILELYDLGCTISRAGARSLSLVIPYFGYATMDRALLSGEVVTAKTRARLLSAIPPCEGGSRIILLDLHAEGIEFYFGDGHVTHHLSAGPLIASMVASLSLTPGFVVGATDAGRAKVVQQLAADLEATPAFVYKRRQSDGSLSVTGVNADVAGKDVVIYDDMIRTGGSLVQAARAYRAAGARSIHAIATHLILPGDALETLLGSGLFDSIGGTNSHPGSLAARERGVRVASVAHLMSAVALPRMAG